MVLTVLDIYYTRSAKYRYNEALQLFRNSYDPVWHGCTLEGIATAAVIDAWSSGQGLVRPSSIIGLRSPLISLSLA